MDSHCLWCGRTFTPRATGGSAQRFCCTGHRQQFWIAARRWTMRAIEVGLLLGRLLEGVSRERARCLKGIPRPEIPRWLSTFRRASPDAKSRRIWTTANKIRTKEGSACPVLLGQAIRNTSLAIRNRDLACRAADGQSLRRRGRGE
jgi:hypothetical protein